MTIEFDDPGASAGPMPSWAHPDRVEISLPEPEISPEWIEMMAESLRSQGKPVPGEDAASRPAAEPAQSAIEALMADPDYLDDRRDPDRHRELVERVGALFEEADRKEAAEKAAARTAVANSPDAMRVPETPDGYDFAKPALPEGASYDAALEATAREWLHKAGLDRETAARLFNRHHAYALDKSKHDPAAMAAAKAETDAALKRQWGGAYEAKLRDAQAFVLDTGGEKLADLLSATGLGNDLELIRLAADLAGRSPARLGKAGIEKEIARLMKQEGYWDPAHPDHARFVGRVSALYQAAASP